MHGLHEIETSYLRFGVGTFMRDPESEGSDDDGDDEFRDMEGKMYTAAGNEVIAYFPSRCAEKCPFKPLHLSRLIGQVPVTSSEAKKRLKRIRKKKINLGTL